MLSGPWFLAWVVVSAILIVCVVNLLLAMVWDDDPREDE